jgi:hypothetical protein
MNILINGAAGTGKTYLTNKLKELYGIRVGSTTWVSSLLTNSSTYYHNLNLKVNYEKEQPKVHKKTSRDIIIDESSMLSSEQLHYLNESYPYCNFILIGDFNQLKPVEGNTISSSQIDYVINLNVQHRSIDNRLNVFLNNILNNCLTVDDLSTIEGRTLNSRQEIYKLNSTTLYYTNDKRINHNGEWEIFNEKTKTSLGTKVIGKNIIIDENDNHIFRPKNAEWKNNEMFVVDRRINNTHYVLKNEIRSIVVSISDMKFFETAEAITIHKSQGLTITGNVVIDLDSIFNQKHLTLYEKSSLFYVACSRVKSMSQLYFIGKIGKFTTWNVLNTLKVDLSCDNDYLINMMKTDLNKNPSTLLINLTTKKMVNLYNTIYVTKIDHLKTKQMVNLLPINRRSIDRLKKSGLSNLQILDKYRVKVTEEQLNELIPTISTTTNSDNNEELDEIFERLSKQDLVLDEEVTTSTKKIEPELYLLMKLSNGCIDFEPITKEKVTSYLHRDFVGPVEEINDNILIVTEDLLFDDWEENYCKRNKSKSCLNIL